MLSPRSFFFFFFNDTATTEIYTLSLHDALPIFRDLERQPMILYPNTQDAVLALWSGLGYYSRARNLHRCARSEEHTSELQSHLNLVCRLLLEKKKKTQRCDGP